MIKHTYAGFWRSFSMCGVDVFQEEDGRLIVVLMELRDNPGTSVTNMVAEIATYLVSGFIETGLVIDPCSVRWVEHYEEQPDKHGHVAPWSRETWDEVVLAWECDKYHSPTWRPLDGDRYQKPNLGKRL